MLVQSSTASEDYAWLGKFPKMREWIGDKIIKSLEAYKYNIPNKDFEDTIPILRNSIEDDTFGVYATIAKAMGETAQSWPDENVWPLLSKGWVSHCYDGGPFFSDAHPVGSQLITNQHAGANPPWFLVDASRALCCGRSITADPTRPLWRPSSRSTELRRCFV